MASLINFLNNPNQAQVEDIDNIQVSATGKVIFYKGTTPILALGKVYNLYIDLISPLNEMGIYFVIEERGWVYKFTFASLTDLNGKSYTAFDTFTGDPAVYYAKVVEVYEDLNALFAACCASGGGGGSVDSVTGNIVDNTDPANPVVTQVQSDWSETDNTSPAYIANKPALDFVESVTAGDDVTIGGTATDPTVGVTPNTFVRLSGTESGFPITGDVEFDVSSIAKRIYTTGAGGAYTYLDFLTDGEFDVITSDGTNTSAWRFRPSGQFSGGSVSFALTALAGDWYLHVSDMKKQFWTKAGTPDANDDVDDGYLVGSLIWDTTNSKMYKCTDNTATAAVWSEVFNGGSGTSKSYLGGRGVISMGAGNATYIPIYSLSGTNTNQANDLTNYSFRSMTLLDDTTFLGISASTSTSQPATGAVTITLVVNGVDSSLTLTIAAGSAAGQFTSTGSVSASAGDTVSWKYSNAASTSSAVIGVCMALITIP